MSFLSHGIKKFRGFSKRKKWLWFIVALVALLALGKLTLNAIGIGRDPAQQWGETAVVSKADIASKVVASGKITPFKSVNVGARVSGEIKSLKVTLGQTVHKGDVIAVIDAREQGNTVQKSQSNLNINHASVRTKEALLQKYQLELTRHRNMFAVGATSKEQLEAAQANVAVTKNELSQAQEQVKLAQTDLEMARLQLNYTQVVAPIDGVVLSLAVEEGQMINALQSAPTIATIAQLDKMTIKAEISETDINQIKVGMPAQFEVLGDTKKYDSTLRALDPAPVSAGQNGQNAQGAVYFIGYVDVDNPEQKLKSSMTANVTFIIGQVTQVLSVPLGALGDMGVDKNVGAFKVKVISEHAKEPQERWVHIGLKDSMNAQILDGLNEGERVVLMRPAVGNKSEAK